MIVDASVIIDAVTDSGARGEAARAALAAQPAAEPLVAPGHFAFESSPVSGRQRSGQAIP